MMKTHPPRYAIRFLRWFCRKDYIEEIEGDLTELFVTQYEQAPVRTQWTFLWKVLHYFRPDFIKSFATTSNEIPYDMFKNHLKSAWRNILKRKELSLLNVLGLSIGMAACLLILQYVEYEKSYDTFHPDVSRLYRVNLGMSDPGDANINIRATNHPALGPSMKQDFPQVEDFTRLVDVSIFAGSSVISYKADGKQIISFYEENIYVADSSTLNMFGYPLLKGDPATALVGLNRIVITESLSKRYFGDEDPMGKRLSLNGAWDVTVSGVLKDLPENTHLKIGALLASNYSEELNSTWIWPEYYTYIKLAPNTDVKSLENQMERFTHKYLGDVMENLGIQEKMYLQAISDIHLSGNYLKEAQENGNYKTVSFLMTIAIMILLIAWINYINLATSRSVERASEVGIRKVVGARKIQIVSQFLIESALMNVIAISLAILIVFLLTPSFNQLIGRSTIGGALELWKDSSTWGVLLLMLIGGTFLAGLYPAFILSSYQPVKTIKGKLFKSGKKINFRHAMVVFQFAISLIMIVGTLTVFHQLSFMRNQNMGFNMDQMLVVKTPSIIDSTYTEKGKLFREKLLQNPQIRQLTVSSDIPGHIIQNNNSIKKKGQSASEAAFATYVFTDEYYLPTYELELIAGRNFSEKYSTDQETVILNEKAVELLGFSTPDEAIGQIITRKLIRWADVKVVGVVKNINHRSLAHKQEAFAFFNRQIMIDYYSIKVSTEELPRTLQKIEETYGGIYPANPFESFFLDDYFAEQYKSDQQFGSVFSLFAGLAILVACLGLFGLISYITARRTKEIGIRKIMGASASQILVLLGKQFVWMVLIAAALAIPLAWWGGDQWLNKYAYRADLSAWLFIIPVLLVLLITISTVLWKSSKAARNNPADALRYE